MVGGYSQLIVKTLLALVLGGITFAAYPALGNATSPTNTQNIITANVHYSLNPAEPSRIDKVSFTLPFGASAQDPASVRIRLGDTAGSYPCALIANTWSCETADRPALVDADHLEVMLPR